MYVTGTTGAQKPLHVITVTFSPFTQSVYYENHVCHFVFRTQTFTECSIRTFRSDMTDVLSGLRSQYLKYPALRDDIGLLEYAGPKLIPITYCK